MSGFARFGALSDPLGLQGDIAAWQQNYPHSIASSARASSEGRYSEAKSLGGLEIDHKVNLGALLDAAIVRHGVLENPSDLHAHLAIPF